MVPNETQHSTDAVKMTAGLNLLVAIWFFVSPWVYGAYHMANAWNSWIIGAVLAIGAAICLNASKRNAANLSWLSVVLAVWVFFSPWIFHYNMDKDRLINSLCVGVVVFVLSMVSTLMASGSPSTTGVPHRM